MIPQINKNENEVALLLSIHQACISMSNTWCFGTNILPIAKFVSTYASVQLALLLNVAYIYMEDQCCVHLFRDVSDTEFQ